jgi:transcriptional regulator of acetoin/glycerol metabolism
VSQRASRPPPPVRTEAPAEEEMRALLVRHQGNVTAIARELGKDRVQIHRWMKRYNLSPDDFRGAP